MTPIREDPNLNMRLFTVFTAFVYRVLPQTLLGGIMYYIVPAQYFFYKIWETAEI